MEFKYTSAKTVLAKLYSDLNLQLEVRVEDVLEWVCEGMEYIGVPAQYTDMEFEGEIDNYRMFLPCDLIMIKQVLVNGAVVNFSNHTAMRTLKVGHKNQAFNTPEVTYNQESGCLLLSIQRGKVRVFYLGLKTDSEGFPMVLDEIRYLDALINYVIFKVKKAEMFSGRISPQEFEYYKMDWEKARIRAATFASMPDPERAVSIGRQFQRLIPNISAHKQMFADYASLERSR